MSGIGGLPFASKATLAEELRLVERVISLDCVVGYQRLESQPGALVTEHPARFDMITEAKTFTEFLDYFERRKPGDVSVPMIRFRDAELEAAVQRTSDQVDAMAWEHRDERKRLDIQGRTRLKNTAPWTQQFSLGDWLGSHRAPAKWAQEPVTVVRSVDGITLPCTPSVSPRRFSDPTLVQGEDGAILLSALAAFERPTTVASAVTQLGTKARLDPESAREVIDHLVDGRFLQPA